MFELTGCGMMLDRKTEAREPQETMSGFFVYKNGGDEREDVAFD